MCMPLEIRIAGYVAASFLLEREPQQWHTILILDSQAEATELVSTHARSHLCLRFDDIVGPRPNHTTPTKMAIATAIAFAQEKDKLLVCCRAGRGRSVALAYVICCQQRGVNEALRLLDPTRQRPNRLVIVLADELLDTLDVLTPFDDWRRQNAHIRLSDYEEEMEREIEALERQGASNRICRL